MKALKYPGQRPCEMCVAMHQIWPLHSQGSILDFESNVGILDPLGGLGS